MKYRARPVEVEAVRFTGDINRLRGFTCGSLYPVDEEDRGSDPEGVAEIVDKKYMTWKAVHVGDWIVKVPGGFRVFSDEEFKEQFELVTNE